MSLELPDDVAYRRPRAHGITIDNVHTTEARVTVRAHLVDYSTAGTPTGEYTELPDFTVTVSAPEEAVRQFTVVDPVTQQSIVLSAAGIAEAVAAWTRFQMRRHYIGD